MNSTKACSEFSREIKVGDLVFATKGWDTILGYGFVTGTYEHRAERLEYKNVLETHWYPLEQPYEIVAFQIPTKTLTRITSRQDYLRMLLPLIKDFNLPPSHPKYSVQDALDGTFFNEEQFNRILETIHSQKNLILQGPPGVGKTFIARKIAYCLIGRQEPEQIQMVQFHQSYSYEDFVQGYRPTKEGGFTLKNGIFFQFCKRAESAPEQSFVFIIDEINRGNLSRIFGELLMLIEADKRSSEYQVPLTYSDAPFYVPPKLFVLGLMNTADRSLAMVDYALRRRFAFEELTPAFNTNEFKDYMRKSGVESTLVDRIVGNVSELNEEISNDKELGPGFQIGHSYFVPKDRKDKEWVNSVVKSQIEPLLREYWFESPKKVSQAIAKLLIQ